MNNSRRWMLALAALPFLYLPLRAAESPPLPSDEASSEPAPAAAAADAEEQDEIANEEAEAPAPRSASPSGNRAEQGERLSLDNNLSFPADI